VNPFRSRRSYEDFIYTLPQRFPAIVRTTLVVAQRGARMATLAGEITFQHDYRLVVKERLSFDAEELVIERYGYEVWRGSQQLYWYDSQPHPHDATLAATHPHHKHIPPDIKHHRVLAPGLAFTEPNLPFLIREIEALIQQAREHG
jgi:hypothetical protein